MRKFVYFSVLIVVLFFFGCTSNTALDLPELDLPEPVNVQRYTSGSSGPNSFETRDLINEAAIQDAFTLDYRPLRAEPASTVDTLSASDLASVSGSLQSITAGGGLRSLTDYMTSYYNAETEQARIRQIQAAQEAGREGQLPASDQGLTVIDWGPQGLFSAAIQRPSIYVIFSQPMVPVASLGQASAVSPLVTITPSIRGTFRWYGTSFLSFEADEPCQSQQNYTITVSSNASSLSGAAITGERVFSFHTETLSIRSFIPGEEFRAQTNMWFSNDNVPPEAARLISLVFNYPVYTSDINQYLEITENNIQKRFTLRQIDEYKIIAELIDPVEFDREIRINLKSGARSRGGSLGTPSDQIYSFRTPGPFAVTSLNRNAWSGSYSNMFDVIFNQNIDVSTVDGALSTIPEMTITNENYDIYGNMIRLFNLPVRYGDKFNITVASSVQDIYGRRLGSPYTSEITMPAQPPPTGEVRFLDYRDRVILEAEFAPRYLFEYRNNLQGSRYSLSSITNPWINMTRFWDNPPPFVVLPPGETNVRYIEEMDLTPYLNEQGRGFVAFNTDMILLTSERLNNEAYRAGTTRSQSGRTIQVTDLAMTVRYGFNKAAVLVTSLSTGQPVEGAKISMLSPELVNSGADLTGMESFAEGVTGSNGLAVINMGSLLLRNNTYSRYYWAAPYFMAEKDEDRVIFDSISHNMWRFGVYPNSPQSAEEIIPFAFMFSDRGLYKPGETLTFRGVDRSKVLGMYTIYQGDYTITLEESSYRPQQSSSITGVTTDSGSFFGQIQIPEDLRPGSYSLVYRRGINGEANDEVIASIPVTVAFFERLSFQAAISSASAPVILGGEINLTLSANYLSGGSLSGAAWEGSWFEERTFFQSPSERGFVFGPRRGWDSMRHIASDGGTLTAGGTAELSQTTTGAGKVTGAPYVYKAEARVTDLSNQMISASRSVIAHPAGFYIGLNSTTRGFIRAGQDFTCDYITVDVNGARTSGNSHFLQSGAGARQLKIELIREEWRRVQQQGVAGYIYDQYVREEVVDSVQTITIQNSGNIRVRPSSAGFHILRVSSLDREGRTALTEITFYATGSGGYWNMNNPSEIRLVPDQDMYEPGETAQILMQSSLPEGYYLITVEREGVFTEEVRYIEESVSVIDIPIARNYVPVVYVSVSSYSVRSGPPTHEYGSPDLDKPQEFFGITHLFVDSRTKGFSVSVETSKNVYRPGEEVTITLTAIKDGRPLSGAELSLMAVDRGVLDLINYRVPDPIEYFYSTGNFPLWVTGGDTRSLLMDPVTYTVMSRMGGDASNDGGKMEMADMVMGAGAADEERIDFNPTAVFEPMLITDANGRVTHTFTLPDNLTTYRVTVFGVRGDLFSLKESEIAAQNRINVREVVPRRMRERDTAEVGVLITNLDSSTQTITVRLDIGGPLANVSGGLARMPGQAFVDGVAEQRITVRSGQNAVVYFDVAAVKEGNVTLNFSINSNILNERLVREMIIERPYVMETFTTMGTITGDSASEGLVIPSYADNNMGSLTVSLDATRLSLLDSAVTYLFRYPYGCLEQRASAVLPLVIFGEHLEALSLRSEVSDPRRVVEDELRSWGNIQLPDGGFPYWPSGTRGDFYVSLRIAHIIAIAGEKEIALPSSLNVTTLVEYLNREYQEMQTRRSNSRDYIYQSYLQSYMLYVTALLGERVDPSRLADILGRTNVDPSVLAFTGMTYRAMGRNTDASAVAQRLRGLIRLTARSAEITDPLERQRYSYFGGTVEQLALTLQFFVDQYPGDEINTRLLYALLENQRSGSGFWNNTAVTSRVLSAVDALIRAENLAATDVRGAITLAGVELLQGTFRGLGARAVINTFEFGSPSLLNLPRDRMQTLNFTRSGTGNLYYSVSLRYAIPSELQTIRDEGLGVFMAIYDVITGEEVAGTALQSGRTYRARVSVSSTRDRTYVALRVPVPSGAEILDSAFVTTASYSDMPETEIQERSSWLSHKAIMDNEIQYFWDQFNRGETTVSFLFRTARRGVYPTPPAQAECMYEPEVFGRSRGLIYIIE